MLWVTSPRPLPAQVPAQVLAQIPAQVAAPASEPELRPEVVRALVGANIDVLRVDRAVAQLESIFMRLTQAKDMPS